MIIDKKMNAEVGETAITKNILADGNKLFAWFLMLSYHLSIKMHKSVTPGIDAMAHSFYVKPLSCLHFKVAKENVWG